MSRIGRYGPKTAIITAGLMLALICTGLAGCRNLDQQENPSAELPVSASGAGAPAASEDLSKVQYDLVPFQEQGLWGYKDIAGQVMVPPQYLRAEYYSEGRVLVELEEKKYAYLDQAGKNVIGPFNAAYALSFSEGLAARGNRQVGEYLDINGKTVLSLSCGVNHAFHDGLALVGLGSNLEKWGFIDKSGQWIVAPQFSCLAEFNEGLACACIDGKTGFIDKSGNWVIPPQFSGANSFAYGLAAAARDGGKFGYIDKTGHWVIEPQFDVAHYFGSDAMAEVLIGKDWHHIDRTGKIVDKFYPPN